MSVFDLFVLRPFNSSRTREDTVRCILASLTDEGGNDLAQVGVVTCDSCGGGGGRPKLSDKVNLVIRLVLHVCMCVCVGGHGCACEEPTF